MGYKLSTGTSNTGGSDPAFDDSFSIRIQADDFNSAPSDLAAYNLDYTQLDSVSTQSEAVELGFPSGNYGENSITPTDAKGFLVSVWLASSAGSDVATPSNADGANNGTYAVISTAPTVSNPEIMTSQVGTNIGAIVFSSAIYRGWFSAQTVLQTSTVAIVAKSSNGLFADITMFTQSLTNTTTDNLTGNFTFNLYAAGVNTLAKIQSLQIIHKSTDAAAGVSPAILTVDAGALELNITL